MSDSQLRDPGFESPFATILSIFIHSVINEFLPIDGGGNVSEQSLSVIAA